MTPSIRFVLFGFAAAVCAAAPASAHHSLAMYDRSQNKEVIATVKAWDWASPHSFIHVVIPKPDGTMEEANFEGTSVYGLSRTGWSKEMMHPGDKITIHYNPRSDGHVGGLFQIVVTADGKKYVGPFANQAGPDAVFR